jgi:hypothetical protein
MSTRRWGPIARGIDPGLARSAYRKDRSLSIRVSERQKPHTLRGEQRASGAPPPPFFGNQKTVLGNPAGRKPGSRNRLSDEIISSFLRDWRKHGDKALEKVRRTQPAAYCKLAVLLVPKEHKVEHTDTYTNLSTEQIEAYIAEIQERHRRAAGHQAGKLIDGEPVETTAAITTPLQLEPPRRNRNRLLQHAESAVGPQLRKRKAPLRPRE